MQNCENPIRVASNRIPWNKGKLTGAKPPLRPRHVWSIRTKLQMADRKRDLALFNLAIDSKLRGCDIVALKVEDIAPHGYAIDRATVRQRKTGRPVRFEITEQTRQALDDYIRIANRKRGDFLFRAASAKLLPLDPTICSSRRRLDKRRRAGQVHVWHTFTPADQGYPHLSSYRQSASGTVAAWAH